MLALACSVDAFALGFAYGGRRIRIPAFSCWVATLCCTLFLGGALLLGELLRHIIPGWLTVALASGVLFIVGVVKFFDQSEPMDGDMNKDQIISPAEAALLSVVLSLDGLAVGFGAGIGSVNIPSAVIASVVFGITAIMGGYRLGGKLSRALPFNPSKIGGVILIGLAISPHLPL
jgi:putative Mn2+ efflux pump MntP